MNCCDFRTAISAVFGVVVRTSRRDESTGTGQKFAEIAAPVVGLQAKGRRLMKWFVYVHVISSIGDVSDEYWEK